MEDPTANPRFDLSLSVFFPFYNEEANIEPLALRTRAVLEGLVRQWEIILVNDGSRDRTGQIADRLAGLDPRIRAVYRERNGGYGAALRSGFAAARLDYVFFTDGDGQFDVREIDKLLLLAGQADIVCGIRQNRQDNRLRKINSACWAALVQKMLQFRCPDVDCAFKLFRRRALDRMELKSTGALISAEILARATRDGCRIVSVPVTHLPRTAGAATGARFGVIFRAFKELRQLRRDILSGGQPGPS